RLFPYRSAPSPPPPLFLAPGPPPADPLPPQGPAPSRVSQVVCESSLVLGPRPPPDGLHLALVPSRHPRPFPVSPCPSLRSSLG
ncbi:unnamed protein product, partial [Closterium sp. NIES-54]